MHVENNNLNNYLFQLDPNVMLNILMPKQRFPLPTTGFYFMKDEINRYSVQLLQML